MCTVYGKYRYLLVIPVMQNLENFWLMEKYTLERDHYLTINISLITSMLYYIMSVGYHLSDCNRIERYILLP